MSHKKQIYLDYAATTPLDARVLEVMQPFFMTDFGNPSSIHSFGQRAEAALEAARQKISDLLNAEPEEIIFTSGGTESDNLALRGAALAAYEDRGASHILISPVEHDAVSKTAEHLAEHFGFQLDYLPVDEFGMVHPDDVAKRLHPETALVSVILGNNEIGTINPIREIAALCKESSVPLHSDAVQCGAHLALDVKELGADLISIGAHKFYGPKGVGALYVRRGTQLINTQVGGSQEFGIRAGTPNLAYIVGMARALELAQSEIGPRTARVNALRERIISGILESIPDSRLTGHPDFRLANHASFVFRSVDGNALLMLLDDAGFACSSGSACKTGDAEPSDVILALGIPPDWALGSLRVTAGMSTTDEEIDDFLNALPKLVERVRRLELA